MAVIVRQFENTGEDYSMLSELVDRKSAVIVKKNAENKLESIAFDSDADYIEYLYNENIRKKLAEAEAQAGDPDNWIPCEDVFGKLDKKLEEWRKLNK